MPFLHYTKVTTLNTAMEDGEVEIVILYTIDLVLLTSKIFPGMVYVILLL